MVTHFRSLRFANLGQVKAKLNADREDIERREKAMNALEAAVVRWPKDQTGCAKIGQLLIC